MCEGKFRQQAVTQVCVWFASHRNDSRYLKRSLHRPAMAQQTCQITGWNDHIRAIHSVQSGSLAAGIYLKKGVGFPIISIVCLFLLSNARCQVCAWCHIWQRHQGVCAFAPDFAGIHVGRYYDCRLILCIIFPDGHPDTDWGGCCHVTACLSRL